MSGGIILQSADPYFSTLIKQFMLLFPIQILGIPIKFIILNLKEFCENFTNEIDISSKN